jgi:hypothetical protein
MKAARIFLLLIVLGAAGAPVLGYFWRCASIAIRSC